ncbi:hypothetical protein MBLNU457_4345t1 [Dothideomycetes sp. NU457]
MAFFQALPWHEGEQMMHSKLRVPDQDNPTVPRLSAQATNMLQRAPLLAIGTVDAENRPWTTIWGGETGFAQSLGNSIIGVRTPVAARFDPVVEIMVGKEAKGEIVKEVGEGRMMSALSIDLMSRKRVKLSGRMIAGALSMKKDDESDEGREGQSQSEVQLALKIEQSLGNCPKYLNKKEITPASTNPTIVSESTRLCPEAVSLLAKSDIFFMSTSHNQDDMDTNHRGGAPGFVRNLSNTEDSTTLVYPEYSGNRLYQSLGNLMTDPLAGLCFPDFETGDCLYVTGTAEILIGKDAASVLPKSNLAVKITLTAARYVSQVLPFRGTASDMSPYNPRVRYLKTENSLTVTETSRSAETAKLLSQTPLTPTISRFRFALENAATYTAGQYVTLDFSEHLDIGYSHMRDDDPRSLNDDFVRTFTVSSPPGVPPRPSKNLADDEFEITIRRVGVVTDLLFKHGKGGSRPGTEFEVGMKGFGGSFQITQNGVDSGIGFIAAGVGITPLLPCLSSLDTAKLDLLWSLRREDVRLALDVLRQYPELKGRARVFLTGGDGATEETVASINELVALGAAVEYRRMLKQDVDDLAGMKRFFVCTGTPHRMLLLQWLEGKEVVFEDFNF